MSFLILIMLIKQCYMTLIMVTTNIIVHEHFEIKIVIKKGNKLWKIKFTVDIPIQMSVSIIITIS